MPIIHKKPKPEVPYEKRTDINIKKLMMHITIVPSDAGPAVNKLFKTLGVSCQFTQRGVGTASKKVREILGMEDNHKELIFTIVPEELVPNMNRELEAFFAASIKNKGIAFVVPLESIMSVRVYNFLADML